MRSYNTVQSTRAEHYCRFHRYQLKQTTGNDTEISEIGKQGLRKCRIVAVTEDEEKIIIIRPEDYPIEKI